MVARVQPETWGVQTLQPINILVMWSGGIDSTFTLARLLKETNHNIHAHHIHICNRERRNQHEERAINALVPKLKGIRDFTLSASAIDHRQYLHIPLDMAIVCFEAGAIAREHINRADKLKFDKWTIGTHKAEGHNHERWEVIKHATAAACWPNKPPEFELQPFETKGQEMVYLKELGLLNDCWFCRTPIGVHSCGMCKTCIEVKEELNHANTNSA